MIRAALEMFRDTLFFVGAVYAVWALLALLEVTK